MPPISRPPDRPDSALRRIAAGRSRCRALHRAIQSISAVVMMLSAATALADAPRAAWVWEADTFRLLDDDAHREEIISFLARRKLDTLYLYADEYRGRNVIRDEPGKYRRLIAALHDRGYRAYALLGSWYLKTPEYILPERRQTAVRMFQNVIRYNANSRPAERFDGVNIDIEPYLLDDWNEKLMLRATQYLELAAEFMRLKRNAGSTFAVGPAMPFWFDGIEQVEWRGKRQRLSDHVQDVYDYVAIMDYRNFARGRDSIVSHAKDELEYADRMGKTVVIGVETIRTEPRKVTFYGMGLAAMEEQLAIAESEFASHPSFAGFAIHHLRSYRAMPDRAPPAP